MLIDNVPGSSRALMKMDNEINGFFYDFLHNTLFATHGSIYVIRPSVFVDCHLLKLGSSISHRDWEIGSGIPWMITYQREDSQVLEKDLSEL